MKREIVRAALRDTEYPPLDDFEAELTPNVDTLTLVTSTEDEAAARALMFRLTESASATLELLSNERDARVGAVERGSFRLSPYTTRDGQERWTVKFDVRLA